ncbi:hypothetical protein THRCLA_02666 [Thraustotheca clavata]|uniref:C2H2-type domain-containing protein n=1 Tax=Thraustotheca clavata TaxID=74557 RepID=A0A1W0A4J8_9STRA|nr:hypothetical protein THRCLA_02666 [Thraustotheca clavata]
MARSKKKAKTKTKPSSRPCYHVTLDSDEMYSCPGETCTFRSNIWQHLYQHIVHRHNDFIIDKVVGTEAPVTVFQQPEGLFQCPKCPVTYRTWRDTMYHINEDHTEEYAVWETIVHLEPDEGPDAFLCPEMTCSFKSLSWNVFQKHCLKEHEISLKQEDYKVPPPKNPVAFIETPERTPVILPGGPAPAQPTPVQSLPVQPASAPKIPKPEVIIPAPKKPEPAITTPSTSPTIKIPSTFSCPDPSCTYTSSRIEHIATHINQVHTTDSKPSLKKRKLEKSHSPTSPSENAPRRYLMAPSGLFECPDSPDCSFASLNWKCFLKHIASQHRNAFTVERLVKAADGTYLCPDCSFPSSKSITSLSHHSRDEHGYLLDKLNTPPPVTGAPPTLTVHPRVQNDSKVSYMCPVPTCTYDVEYLSFLRRHCKDVHNVLIKLTETSNSTDTSDKTNATRLQPDLVRILTPVRSGQELFLQV